MGDFNDILKRKLNQLGIARQVEAVGIVESVTNKISKHISKEDFEVISFNRGTLKIKAANSAVSSELNYLKPKYQKEPIKNIRIIN